MSNNTYTTQFAIAAECERATISFMAHFDAREFREMEQYFAPDGVWLRPEGAINGIDELRTRMTERPASAVSRHVITNLRTTVTGPQSAVVNSYITGYRHDFSGDVHFPVPLQGPRTLARCRDEMVLVEGRWKIAHRKSNIEFKAA